MVHSPSVKLESWDGSNITVSVTATTRGMALRRARRWVSMNVARQMKPVGELPKRKNPLSMTGADVITRYYFEFKLGVDN